MSPSPHHDITPRPEPVPPGRWPEFATALAAVNRDLRATLPEQEPLILVAVPAWASAPEQVYVAMADGSWQGNSLTDHGFEEGVPGWLADPSTVLGTVADAAQETVMELLWQAWPVCRTHRSGVHAVSPVTDAGHEERSPKNVGPPVWWCAGGRTGEGHGLAAVGELADALPGKERRAFRRTERETRGQA